MIDRISARDWRVSTRRLTASTALAITLVAVLGTPRADWLIGAAHAASSEGPSTGDTERSARFVQDAQKALEKGDGTTAIIQLKNAVRVDPKNIGARLQLGQLLTAAGDPAAGERELRQARSDGAEPAQVLPALMSAMAQQRKSEALLKEFPEQLAEDTPQIAPDVYRFRALAQAQQGAVADATQSAEKALNAKRTLPNLLLRSQLAASSGDLQLAEALIDEAIAAAPKEAGPLLRKAEMRRAAGDIDAALALANKAIELDRGNEGRLARAGYLIEKRETDKAKADLDAVLQRSPQSPQAKYLQAVIASQANDVAGADKILTSLPQTYLDETPRAKLFAASVAAELGRREQAITMIRDVVARVPGDVLARRSLASLYLQANDAASAASALDPVAATTTDPTTLLLLSELAFRRNDASAASQYLDRAGSAAPDDALVRGRIAVGNLRANRPELGDQQLKDIVLRDPNQRGATLVLLNSLVQRGDIAGAKGVVEAVAAKLPNSPLPEFYRGLIARAENNTAEAQARFKAAIARQADFAPARASLADMAIEAGDTDTARKQLSELLANEPNNTRAMLTLADVEVRAGQPDAAAALLTKAVAVDPNVLQPRLVLANFQLAQNQPKAAETTLNDALRIAPDNIEVMTLLARAQLAGGSPQLAVGTLRQVVTKQPRSAPNEFNLALALRSAGDAAGAKSGFERALQIDPAFLPARQELIAIAIAEKDDAQALRLAKAFQTVQPGANADRLVAATYVGLGKTADGAKVLADSYAKTPDPQTLGQRVALLADDKKYDEALKLIDARIKSNPDEVASQQLRIDVLQRAGREQEAIAGYDAVLKQQPNNLIALNNLAWLLREKNPARARELAEHALVLAPRSAEVIDTLGYLLLQGPDKNRGTELLRRAHALNPDNPQIAFHLAKALHQSGEKKQARQLLDRIAATNAAFDGREEALSLLKTLN